MDKIIIIDKTSDVNKTRFYYKRAVYIYVKDSMFGLALLTFVAKKGTSGISRDYMA